MRFVKGSDLRAFPIFGDVLGRVVFSSERVMFLLMEIPPGGIVPEHSHPHEQMGVCLKGRAEFRSGGERRIVEEGAFYWIKPGEKHSVISLSDGPSLFLDVFNPPREDYLERIRELGGAKRDAVEDEGL
ncbi:cupin domain-containing protein [Candidatus Bathyarchaeota archaeon]|nr:cupin domain-containing protein [Candidatus Bathyarchaeota archaeon]